MTPSPAIRNAILITVNSQHQSIVTDVLYGGETLLNRSLVAMSKSGITKATIVSAPGSSQKIMEMISKVDHRLSLKYDITELSQNEILSVKIKSITAGNKESFLIFEADKFMHPTFLQQVVASELPDKAVLPAYKDVLTKDGQVVFAPSFKEKFKIIFANAGSFNKIKVENADWSLFNSNPMTLSAANVRTVLTQNGSGIISTDVMVCSGNILNRLTDFRSLDEAINQAIGSGLASVAFVKDAWWLRVTPSISKSHIKEMIWKIAFKEISGEFSKAVNSKMSKPLSFYFARKGVTPNTLSNAQLVLFLLASCFLLFNTHWAMIVFAVIWQFSAGVLDRCDGEVARIRNHESESGGRFDMIIDDMRFGLPFIILGAVLYLESQDSLYLFSFGAAFVWFLALTLYEQNFMRKAGYVSRQVMYVDYMKMIGEDSQTTSALKKYAPIAKGDIRTFYVFLLSLFGLKEIVFWVLLAYLTLVPISSFVGVLRFKKEYSKNPGRV